MKHRSDFVIAYDTARNCGDTSTFTTVVLWALMIAFMVISILCLTPRAVAAEGGDFNKRHVTGLADRPITKDEMIKNVRLFK